MHMHAYAQSLGTPVGTQPGKLDSKHTHTRMRILKHARQKKGGSACVPPANRKTLLFQPLALCVCSGSPAKILKEF